MACEVSNNIYKIEVPLPNNPLKYINVYIIKTHTRNLIIDVGMNRKECSDVLNKEIDNLNIDLNKTDFFITHMHADHSGLVKNLAKPMSSVSFSSEDEPFITGEELGSFWNESLMYAKEHGFPELLLKDALDKHPGRKYAAKGHMNARVHIVEDGEFIEVNDFHLRCIKTPGHTKGHMCLYDEDKSILFSGDHILYDITPNISSAYENPNPLGDYLNSLDKIYDLEVKLVLPGHRRTFKDLKKRIDELKKHHSERLNEVLSILDRYGCQNAYSIASKMHWDITFKEWNDFPITQKWFAHSEAIAHLQYLQDKNTIYSERVNDIWVFCK